MKPVMQQLRSLGIIAVNYLDDILIFGRSKEECQNNTSITTCLLQSLGFLINLDKSSLYPSRKCKFLGFVFNSEKMIIELTQSKRQNIEKWVIYFLKRNTFRIRTFAKMLGLLVSACPAVKYGFLYTKRLERQKYLALMANNMSYNDCMSLSPECQNDLAWWSRNIQRAYNDVRNDTFKIEICTDASLTGWGACMEGSALMAGGPNSPKLNKLARQIWQWCIIRNIWIYASYIPSKLNHQADEESRILPPETEWSLSTKACVQKIRADRAEGILVVPAWTNQPWFPLINKLQYETPVVLEPHPKLLSSVFRERHPLAHNLTLVAYKFSGRPFKLKKTPPCAVETIIKSLSDATAKQYSTTYKLWWKYCSETDTHPFEATSSSLIAFLQHVLDRTSCQYGTINSHRSALSLILPGQAGADPMVCRFLKGVSRIRPAVPKYNSTWDPHQVLSYFETLELP
ncbi:hypothetical protein NQ317_016241 [Molorchus minor]|uniref:Reverse transcriptase domain-containing protein n=1 Tax=Molorchus minor TaxID=1323400 RepID=A0ABQ9IR71_9CUCU|nr:hypothetical protein NQ317_016241 [Molorchus minor]